MMKIIAGDCRGMKLITPKGYHTRPTSARVREAVMSILQPWLDNAVFIDFFAGSGAMGLEALSRGAAACYFIEEDRKALLALRQNLRELERRLQVQELAPPVAQVLSRNEENVWPLLKRLGKADIIWADPPYVEVVAWLKAKLADKLREVSRDGSVFVLEAAASSLAELELVSGQAKQNWVKVKEKVYGETAIVVWERQEML